MPKDIKLQPKNQIIKNIAIFGFIILALAIAVTVWLSNGQKDGKVNIAGQCSVNEKAAKAINELKGGDLLSLIGTGTGRAYAEMSFLDELGIRKTIADFSGKPLLVNFWATWCAPCREEMPSINSLANIYEKDEFEVITINLDLGEQGQAKARAFFDEIKLDNLTLYLDNSFSSFELLIKNGVALGLPATLLLDDKGCEIAVLQGPATWDSENAIRIIDSLISSSN